MDEKIILIRKQTDCPYMVIKKALWATNGNVEEAINLLREKYFVFGDHPQIYIQDWEIEYDAKH